MNKFIIFIIIAFLVIIYIFTYIKWRKRKKSRGVSAIDEFKGRYVDKTGREQYVDLSSLYNSEDEDTQDHRIDFIEKDEFISEIQTEINNSKIQQPQKKYELHF